MKKYLPMTVIELPKRNHAKCPIYTHNGKFYIKANKPNTHSYRPFYFNSIEYTEVEPVEYENETYWFTI